MRGGCSALLHLPGGGFHPAAVLNSIYFKSHLHKDVCFYKIFVKLHVKTLLYLVIDMICTMGGLLDIDRACEGITPSANTTLLLSLHS